MAVNRTGFVLSGFFFVMALVTIGLKKSGSIRANIHNGAWMICKFLILIGIAVSVYSLFRKSVPTTISVYITYLDLLLPYVIILFRPNSTVMQCNQRLFTNGYLISCPLCNLTLYRPGG